MRVKINKKRNAFGCKELKPFEFEELRQVCLQTLEVLRQEHNKDPFQIAISQILTDLVMREFNIILPLPNIKILRSEAIILLHFLEVPDYWFYALSEADRTMLTGF